jgi:uncharacterized membrane protein required for colicin V production
MAAMHWTDWAGLALLAYGLAAGWVRGFAHQSTRVGVILGALILASLSEAPTAWLAEQFDFKPGESPAAVPLLQLVLFGLGILILTVVRGLAFLWIEGPETMMSRAAGALLGLLGSLLMFLVLESAVVWSSGSDAVVDARSYALTQRMINAVGRVPSPPRPLFLDPARFPGAEDAELGDLTED